MMVAVIHTSHALLSSVADYFLPIQLAPSEDLAKDEKISHRPPPRSLETVLPGSVTH